MRTFSCLLVLVVASLTGCGGGSGTGPTAEFKGLPQSLAIAE